MTTSVVVYKFVALQKNGQEAAVIESPPETLQSIGNLLGGPPEKYELSITNKITVCSMCSVEPLYSGCFGTKRIYPYYTVLNSSAISTYRIILVPDNLIIEVSLIWGVC